ncbi:MAG: stage II sporulation protein R, partial [Clostridiales bacterium]|nr:stage II sporulation protein R [Clostridiales bacterium]
LCVSLCTGLWAGARQRQLSGELVRLHVIAQSDSSEDQQLKLKVRDSVLAALEPRLKDAENPQEAAAIIEESLPLLCDIADIVSKNAGMDYSSTSSLDVENYPSRKYEGFALPAGDYLSLKISLGDGGGQNWWCVVFPPLCLNAASETEAIEALSDSSQEIITLNGEEYRLKFHVIEIYEKLRSYLT